jgi:hypothetical protein
MICCSSFTNFSKSSAFEVLSACWRLRRPFYRELPETTVRLDETLLSNDGKVFGTRHGVGLETGFAR